MDASSFRAGVVETSHLATAYALVAEGEGLTVNDPYTALSCFEREDVVLRPFQPEIRFAVNLLQHANHPVPLIVKEFIVHLGYEHRAISKVQGAATRVT